MKSFNVKDNGKRVLILVLVEDGWLLKGKFMQANFLKGLNPCFSGRWLVTHHYHIRLIF
jgi:hypothetical protein